MFLFSVVVVVLGEGGYIVYLHYEMVHFLSYL